MSTIVCFHSTGTGSAHPKISGICRKAAELGYDVQRFDIRSTEQIRQSLVYWQPDGCIVEASAENIQFDARVFRAYPTVFLDCNPKRIGKRMSRVIQDADAIAKVAADELCSLNLASYGFTCWPEAQFWSTQRKQAFQRAMRRRGHKVSTFTPQTDSRDILAIREQLATWLASLKRPAGIFTSTDALAVQVIRAATDAGLSIPGDIAVVGTDNEEFLCDSVRPSLSSIDLDFEQAGAKTVELLHQLMANPSAASSSTLFSQPTLIRRTSTRRSPRRDSMVAKALDLIRSRATLGLTAREVLAIFPCSRRTAEIRFKEVAKRSILDEIHAVQIESAQKLLANRNCKITTIVEQCGFASTSAFQRLFRKTTGMDMRTWRQNLFV